MFVRHARYFSYHMRLLLHSSALVHPNLVDLCFFSSSPYFLKGLRLDIYYISGWLGAILIVVANK